MAPENTIGARLRIARQLRELSNRKLAGQLEHIDRPTLARIQRGDRTPTLATVQRLAAALRVRWEWLATGEGAMAPESQP